MSATEQAYPETPVGEIEIKKLPGATLIVSKSGKSYFEEDNQLFRPLFRYIQDRDIAMTTPVEAEINPGEMFFYIGDGVESEELTNTDDVTVRELPERSVASIGVRGSYSSSNFQEAKAKLEAWLANQSDWRATGDAKGVFWDGPFTLWFLKRFEVHIPVEEKEEQGS
ncbi:heme-binding protein [Puniceicoccus vermicola]|uniref:Heme-binding protein n=1 Tax=Puniceicoccus vermicola TaxID=388746 RepID=A0A7X1AXX1_9BACT|nr:heme-binding protein [Puniceicoccus vermicola]MBC2601992.1 heme-binding protein [Puniceicoccus vermicola]